MAVFGRVGTVLGLLGAAWLLFTLSVTRDLAASFRTGTARYEQPALRPDTLPAGDLTRGGLVSPPTHAPPRPEAADAPARLCTGPVDVVFTWVNGSDPAQIARLEQHHGNAQRLAIMYRDYGLLRFAVRSIEKNAPWARHIILYTNGQRPDWYNESALRTRVVTHDEVFKDVKNLPTFNSNAIESNLHRIAGLSECFLYMNDDMFLLDPTPLDYFVDAGTGLLNLHFEGRTAPAEKEMKTNGWFRSVAHSNAVINSWYHPDANATVRHHFAAHYCYFMSRRVLGAMAARWPAQWAYTERNRFRDERDNAIPFLHANVALEEGVGRSTPARNAGGAWYGNRTLNDAVWNRIARRRKPVYCSCLQDRLTGTPAVVEREIASLEQRMCQLFPEPSSLELTTLPNPCTKWLQKQGKKRAP